MRLRDLHEIPLLRGGSPKRPPANRRKSRVEHALKLLAGIKIPQAVPTCRCSECRAEMRLSNADVAIALANPKVLEVVAEVLSDEELLELARTRQVTITGSMGSTFVVRWASGYVWRETRFGSWLHQGISLPGLPYQDCFVAQVLAIKTDEEEVNRVSCHAGGASPYGR